MQNRRLSSISLVVCLVSSLLTVGAAHAAELFVVSKTTDGLAIPPEEGTLRWAITQSNLHNSDRNHPNNIVFHIGDPGVYPAQPFTIEPLMPSWSCSQGSRAALPAITQPVVIDGFTQNAWSGVPEGVHLIEISGKNADTNMSHPSVAPPAVPSTACIHGIFVNTGAHGTVIRGLVIDRWGRNGIFVQNANDVKVRGNIVGFGYDGGWTLATHANGRSGLLLFGAGSDPDDETVIGGSGPLDGNVIGASSTAKYPSTCFTGSCPATFNPDGSLQAGFGIDVEGASPNVRVQGNFIGTDAYGNIGPQSPGNGYIGMFFPTSGNQILNNVVYGAGMVQQPASGMRLYTSADHSVVAKNNLVEGNAFYGNFGWGINITPGAQYNTVRRNYIAPLPPGIAPWPGVKPNFFGGIGVLGSHNRIVENVITGTGGLLPDGISPDGLPVPRRASGILIQSQGWSPPAYDYDTSVGNVILGNSISGNVGLGIDISRYLAPPKPVSTSPLVPAGDGPNPIIPYDPANERANHFQNYPVLAAVRNPDRVIIRASLTSAPNTTYLLQFFTAASAQPETVPTLLPNGSVLSRPFLAAQGASFLKEVTVVTNEGGHANTVLELATDAVPAGSFLTATATNRDTGEANPDFNGETSEFSEAVDLDRGNITAFDHVAAAPTCDPELPVGDQP